MLRQRYGYSLRGSELLIVISTPIFNYTSPNHTFRFLIHSIISVPFTCLAVFTCQKNLAKNITSYV